MPYFYASESVRGNFPDTFLNILVSNGKANAYM